MKLTLYGVLSLSLTCIPVRGDTVRDLQDKVRAVPGFADLPCCGQCALARSATCSPCWGETDAVTLSSCTTASCLCDSLKRKRLTDYIRDKAEYLCKRGDTGTPVRATQIFEQFCAAVPTSAPPAPV